MARKHNHLKTIHEGFDPLASTFDFDERAEDFFAEIKKGGTIKRVSFQRDRQIDGANAVEVAISRQDKTQSVMTPSLLKRQSVDDAGSQFRYSQLYKPGLKASSSLDPEGKDGGRKEATRKNRLRKDDETREKLGSSLRDLFKPCNIELDASEDQDRGQQSGSTAGMSPVAMVKT